MKIESESRLIWFVNRGGMVRSQFRNHSSANIPDIRSEYVHPRVAHSNTNRGGFMMERVAAASNSREATESAGGAAVLVPVDFSPASLKTVDMGASVAQQTNARLILCHAVFPQSHRLDLEAQWQAGEAARSIALGKMHRLTRKIDLPSTCVAEVGTPSGVILKMAKKYAADLIVLTCREHGIWSRLFFGPRIAEQVITEAECHVMVLRAPDDQASA